MKSTTKDKAMETFYSSVTGRTTMINTSWASVMPSVFDRHQTVEGTLAMQDETLAL
jgi:hypothetical protein